MLRKGLKYAGIAFGALVAAVFAGKVVVDARYFNGYDASVPLNVRVAEIEALADFERMTFSFDSTPGEAVPTVLCYPLEAKPPYPCAIFLHGIGQDKRFVSEIAAPFTQAGFAIVSFDQHSRGGRSTPREDRTALGELRDFWQRPAKTVNDTRRLVDYLQTDPRIDPRRIYVLGASYGAITGSTATAFDTRIQAAVLCYGGGNINKLLRARYIEQGAREQGYGAALAVLRPFMSFAFSVADPVRHVAGISPRPVLMQAGRFDGLVAPEASEALYEAAREPKQITWYESDHIGMDEDVVRQVLDEALTWIQEQDRRVLESGGASVQSASL